MRATIYSWEPIPFISFRFMLHHHKKLTRIHLLDIPEEEYLLNNSKHRLLISLINLRQFAKSLDRPLAHELCLYFWSMLLIWFGGTNLENAQRLCCLTKSLLLGLLGRTRRLKVGSKFFVSFIFIFNYWMFMRLK